SYGLTTDQRRRSRPCDNPAIPNAAGGDGTDIGAFEFQSQPISLLAPLRAGDNIVVGFISEAGQTYRFERKDSQPAGSWTTVADQIAGSGRLVQVNDPGAASLPTRFYRLVTLP